MKRFAVIFTVCVLIGIAVAAGFGRTAPKAEFAAVKRWPVKVDCSSARGNELEEKFCSMMFHSLAESESIRLSYRDGEPYFHFIIVPTDKDGYLAVNASAAFVYPPLDGLELASFYSAYCIVPGGLDLVGEDGGTVTDYIAEKMILGAAEWLVWAKMKIMCIKTGVPFREA